MFLNSYFEQQNGAWQFSKQQASDFAKAVAGDFNPIHDTTAKRFCVPGDLLFSMVVAHHGLYEKMKFTFSGMINDKHNVRIQDDQQGRLDIVDTEGKSFLHLDYQGSHTRNPEQIEKVAKNYVRFSGKNFPHIMVPLMEQEGIMINPERPLVIYESMEVEFSDLTFTNPEVKLTESIIESDGKRGSVMLVFVFIENGKEIGIGRKLLRMSGLKPYCPNAIDELVAEFNRRKDSYQQVA
uniref:DUF3581 family protein n=1 Tax=Thaumasiovibrio occultus TaxID=1891184 RepID=UPI000B35C80F|nr:DUF3581 family protein [Thaumasiovibrio occultus]